MNTYTWKILSIDEASATMIVQFVFGEKAISLNCPCPSEGATADWVAKFVPTDTFLRWEAELAGAKQVISATVGETGEQEFNRAVVRQSSTDKLRALIREIIAEETKPN